MTISATKGAHDIALAMKHGIAAGQIKGTVFGFPTVSADIKSMH